MAVPISLRDGFRITGYFGISPRGAPPRPEVRTVVSEVSSVTRKCGTCQHVKRAEIDRRLAAGKPGSQIARDYDLNPSSLHRHRVNCLGILIECDHEGGCARHRGGSLSAVTGAAGQ